MDLIAVGPIAADVSSSFDLYWNSKWSFAPEAISNEKPNEKDRQKGEKRARKIIDKNRATINALGIEPGNWDNLIAKMHNQLVFSEARVVYDIPPKESSREFTRAAKEISELMRKTKKELLIISPYFVPTENGIEEIRELVSRGIKIHILTNSLASNDVVITHSAYKRYRKQLIEAGVELYELRVVPMQKTGVFTAPNPLSPNGSGCMPK
jgi:putative cardiolipin synthase